MAKEQTLEEMRAAAYAAFNDHQTDMNNDPVYREKQLKREARAHKKALKEGRVR